MSLHYTTTDGTTKGRASHFHRNLANAEATMAKQNERAESLGIKARYKLAEHSGEGVEAKDIRD